MGIAEDAARLGNVAQREVLFDGLRIDCPVQRGMGFQGFQLRGEDQTSVVQRRIIEWLDPETVACQKQHFTVAIPQGEREHAAELLDTRFAPRLPGMHDDLGVAVGAKDVTKRRQLACQLGKIVDLAVVHNHDRPVLVEQRLLPARQVNDRQATMRQPDPRLQVHTAFVRSTMELALVQPFEQRTIYLTSFPGIEYADQTTHRSFRHSVMPREVSIALSICGAMLCANAASLFAASSSARSSSGVVIAIHAPSALPG